jgi:hypothetical protein
MSCDDFRKLIQDAINDNLPLQQMEIFSLHFIKCASCREQLIDIYLSANTKIENVKSK